MTWVEASIVLSLLGVMAGVVTRRRRLGRALLIVSIAVLTVLLTIFGREFVADVFQA